MVSWLPVIGSASCRVSRARSICSSALRDGSRLPALACGMALAPFGMEKLQRGGLTGTSQSRQLLARGDALPLGDMLGEHGGDVGKALLVQSGPRRVRRELVAVRG